MCLAHIPSQSGQGTEKMILEEETFREFGYYPGDWAPNSDKKILAACDDCGKVRITSKHYYCALCTSCALKGNKNALGSLPSEETKRKIGDAHKGDKNHMFGKHHTDETKQKMREAHEGKHLSEETRQKMRENHADVRGEKHPNYGKHPSEETRQKMREAHRGEKNHIFGKHHSEGTRQKLRETTKKNWQDPVFIKKVFDGLNAEPNKQEKKVGAILQKHLPKQYAYNGDFSCGITIGGKIPDFVNVDGKKIVIEVFGPWHDEIFMRDHFGNDISWKSTEFGTKAFYSQFGYKCVVFWQEDLEREDVEQFVLSVLGKEKII